MSGRGTGGGVPLGPDAGTPGRPVAAGGALLADEGVVLHDLLLVQDLEDALDHRRQLTAPSTSLNTK